MLREDAYRRFKRHLLSGTLKPGQFVTQAELAELIGVSMNPAREAIQRLQFEKLLRVYPKRGIQIAIADPKSINDAYDFRLLMEIPALQRFAEHAPVASILELTEQTRLLLQRFLTDPDNSDILIDTAEGDWDFHEKIIDHMGNQFLSEQFRLNSTRIRLYQRNNAQSKERMGSALDEHLHILRSCERRQPDEAASSIARHIETSRAIVLGAKRN